MTYLNYKTSQTIYITGCYRCTTNYERQREIFVCFAWVAKHKFLVYDNVILHPQPMCHTFEMISIIIYIKATMISNKSHAHTFYGNVVKSCILEWNEFWIVWLFNSYALLFENLESFKLFSLQILGSWEHPKIFWSQCTRYRKYRKYASWKEMWFD